MTYKERKNGRIVRRWVGRYWVLVPLSYSFING